MTSPSTAIRFRLAACIVISAASCIPAGAAQGAAAMDLPFSAFFKRPIGPRGLEPSDILRSADGQRVRLQGYMVAREQGTPGRFLLTPRPVRLSEHADGEADDLPPATVTVLLDESQRQRTVMHAVEEADGRVSWFRLVLDPDALAFVGSPRVHAAPHRHP
jgi:hypothetical protein